MLSGVWSVNIGEGSEGIFCFISRICSKVAFSLDDSGMLSVAAWGKAQLLMGHTRV